MDFGIWEKFQQLEFGDIGFRQGVRNKRIEIGKHKIYWGWFDQLWESSKDSIRSLRCCGCHILAEMCSWQLETQDGSTRIYRPGLDTQIFREVIGTCGSSYMVLWKCPQTSRMQWWKKERQTYIPLADEGRTHEGTRKRIQTIVKTDAMEPKEEECSREVDIDGQNSQIRNTAIFWSWSLHHSSLKNHLLFFSTLSSNSSCTQPHTSTYFPPGKNCMALLL